MARIDDHIVSRRHVAGGASSAGAGGLVVVVRRRIVLACQVTGRAEAVALGAQLSAMGIMAVATRNAIRVHLALQE